MLKNKGCKAVLTPAEGNKSLVCSMCVAPLSFLRCAHFNIYPTFILHIVPFERLRIDKKDKIVVWKNSQTGKILLRQILQNDYDPFIKKLICTTWKTVLRKSDTMGKTINRKLKRRAGIFAIILTRPDAIKVAQL